MQLYIGPSRASVIGNRDVVKELKTGMLVAITREENCMPEVGKVHSIPPNATINSTIVIHRMGQERAPHKPKWMRAYKLLAETCKKAFVDVQIKDISLYGFELTNKDV